MTSNRSDFVDAYALSTFTKDGRLDLFQLPTSQRIFARRWPKNKPVIVSRIAEWKAKVTK